MTDEKNTRPDVEQKMTDAATDISTTTRVEPIELKPAPDRRGPYTEDYYQTETLMLYKKLIHQTEEQLDMMRLKIRDLEYKLEQTGKVTVVLSHSRPAGPQVCLVATGDPEAQARVHKARGFIAKNEQLLRQQNINMTIQTDIPVNFWYNTPDGSVF